MNHHINSNNKLVRNSAPLDLEWIPNCGEYITYLQQQNDYYILQLLHEMI